MYVKFLRLYLYIIECCMICRCITRQHPVCLFTDRLQHHTTSSLVCSTKNSPFTFSTILIITINNKNIPAIGPQMIQLGQGLIDFMSHSLADFVDQGVRFVSDVDKVNAIVTCFDGVTVSDFKYIT